MTKKETLEITLIGLISFPIMIAFTLVWGVFLFIVYYFVAAAMILWLILQIAEIVKKIILKFR